MTVDTGFLNRLRSRGEEVLTQVSAELSSNPRFMQAMAGALRGKEKLEEAVARALRQMNVPTRTELKRALGRIEALEREVGALKSKAKAATSAGGARKKASSRRPGAKSAGSASGPAS
jgi:polyhydroxyalkanoate synthesis regulator phasin